MSTPISNNTTGLQELLETINNLPNAGGSGGGGNVETCIGTITNTSLQCDLLCYYTDPNLNFAEIYLECGIEESITITAIKNSLIGHHTTGLHHLSLTGLTETVIDSVSVVNSDNFTITVSN